MLAQPMNFNYNINLTPSDDYMKTEIDRIENYQVQPYIPGISKQDSYKIWHKFVLSSEAAGFFIISLIFIILSIKRFLLKFCSCCQSEPRTTPNIGGAGAFLLNKSHSEQLNSVCT